MNKLIVITGAGDHVGAAAVRQLTRLGHRVVAVDGSAERVDALSRSLGVDCFVADFQKLADVQRLADALLERYERIDVLAHNVGAFFGTERALTEDGHERTFQVNYLSPFVLTYLLLPRLVFSEATVVSASSATNRLVASFDVSDLGSSGSYDTCGAYAKAKLAQVLFTRELDRRFGPFGVASAAFCLDAAHGGALVGTTADTLVFLAHGRAGVDFRSGELFVNRQPAQANACADDARLARGLWNRTVKMLDDFLHGDFPAPVTIDCSECPEAGTETCETLAQLGTYCDVGRAAGASR